MSLVNLKHYREKRAAVARKEKMQRWLPIVLWFVIWLAVGFLVLQQAVHDNVNAGQNNSSEVQK